VVAPKIDLPISRAILNSSKYEILIRWEYCNIIIDDRKKLALIWRPTRIGVCVCMEKIGGALVVVVVVVNNIISGKRLFRTINENR